MDWAKRKGMGEEAIQYCRSYALEAERKMGEMLRETERAKPGPEKRDRYHQGTEPTRVKSPDVTLPTLAELGLTKKESADAQMLADIPRFSIKSRVRNVRVERRDRKNAGLTTSIDDFLLPKTRRD